MNTIHYISIHKSLLNRFHDTNLHVIGTDGENTYKVHRLVLIHISLYFEKFFEKESSKIENELYHYTIQVPFPIQVMNLCIDFSSRE